MSAVTAKTMEAGVLSAPREIQMRRVEVPAPAPDEMLVRVAVTCLCGSDLAVYRGTHPYKRPPAILGHELSGVVVEVGSKVRRFAPGDRVCASSFSHCGACSACRQGRPHLCKAKAALGDAGWPGSFAEYVLLKENMAFGLGEEIDLVAGAMVEPLAIALHALRLAALEPGGTIAILGSGNIGLLVLMAATALGLRAVCVDVREDAGRLALALGAEAYLDAAEGELGARVRRAAGDPVDAVLVASGHAGVLDEAATLAAPGAPVVVVSYFERPQQVDLAPFLGAELRLLFSTLCTPDDLHEAVRLLETGEVDPRPLVGETLPLRALGEAMEAMDSGVARQGKLVLRVAAPEAVTG
ncbi:MAG: alcohol dehydrogenase catalytic domain-containing protein [Solirubrobacterales bacterium]